MQNEVVQKTLISCALSLLFLVPIAVPFKAVADDPKKTLQLPTSIGPIIGIALSKEPLVQKPRPAGKKKTSNRLTRNRRAKALSYWQCLHQKKKHPEPGVAPVERVPAPPTSAPSAPLDQTGLDQTVLDQWSSQMIEYGRKYCSLLKSGTAATNEILADVYYDASYVYQQIRDYTQDSDWQNCVDASLEIYRDQYVLPNKGRVPGYWNFSDGLLQSYIEKNDSVSLSAVIALSNDASYSNAQTPVGWTEPFTLSREVAYAIITFINTEKVENSPNERLETFVNQALGHLDQWFGNRNAPYVRSFMVGLTARALIRYWEKTGDPRIVSALSFALNALWDLNWVEAEQAFRYQSAVSESPLDTKATPDLNLLIAPAYAWVAYVTGDSVAARRADKIFASGVQRAYLERPKQFNQNYLWSFDYLRWRSATRYLQ